MVGNSASGVDISIQLSVCAKDVFVSIRDQESPHFEDGFCKYIGLIEEYTMKLVQCEQQIEKWLVILIT